MHQVCTSHPAHVRWACPGSGLTRLAALLLPALAALWGLGQPCPGSQASAGSPGRRPAGLEGEAAALPWFDGTFEAALAEASAQRRGVLVYFWLEGSAFCVDLYRETLSVAEGVQAVGDLLAYSVSVTEEASGPLVSRFGVQTLPTLVVLGPDGSVEDVIRGYIPLAGFVSEMARIRAGTGTVSSLRAAAEAAPDDLSLRFQLAKKLDDIGAQAEALALIDSIKRDDPKGKTVLGAQLHLYDVRDACLAKLEDPYDRTQLDLKPMVKHLSRVRPAPVRFEGWSWIAFTEVERGARKEARRAFAKAWDDVPADQLLFFGGELVRNYWDMRGELTKRDRRVMLEVARRTASEAVAIRGERGEGLPEPAVEAFLELEFEGSPEELVARYVAGLAQAEFLTGDAVAARATLARALELDPASTALLALQAQFEAP